MNKEQQLDTGVSPVVPNVPTKEKRKGPANGVTITVIACISLILCTLILVIGFLTYKGKSPSYGITATGSASCDFESDLIVWRGYFSSYGATTEDAYSTIKRDSESVKDYLVESGISQEEMVFSSINISKDYMEIYNDDGNYIGDELAGYDLYQDVVITSTDIDKVEKISRDISGLLEAGIEFTSDAPEYYYTKLDEVKLQLISDATENAKQRIDIIAEGTGANLDGLASADLGVFQITGTNASEDYSYGGTFNTSSREKTATITVNLNYNVK